MLNGNDRRMGGRLPKKLLGSVLVLSGILLVLWLLVVAKSEYGDRERLSEPRIKTETVQSDDNLEETEEVAENSQPVTVPQKSENNSSGMFGGAVTVFTILIVMLGAAFLWFRKSDSLYTSYFKEVGRHQLGMDQELVVLEVNGEVWVLGRTGHSISLLFKCNEENWKQQSQEKLADSGVFKNIFNNVSNNRQWNL